MAQKTLETYDSNGNLVLVETFEVPDLPYEEVRRREYPALGDQLDAIWKELNYRRLSGESLVAEADAMLNKVLAVKAKYPKPEET